METVQQVQSPLTSTPVWSQPPAEVPAAAAAAAASELMSSYGRTWFYLWL